MTKWIKKLIKLHLDAYRLGPPTSIRAPELTELLVRENSARHKAVFREKYNKRMKKRTLYGV